MQGKNRIRSRDHAPQISQNHGQWCGNNGRFGRTDGPWHRERRGDQAEVILRVNLSINGLRRSLVVEPRWSLLYVLREKLGLTGTKVGCERGECGACTVLIDEVPRYACLTLAVEVQGSEIVTLEGLMHGERLGAVQQAFVEHDAFQCGYCTPGQIMSAEGLLRSNPAPKPDEFRRAMSGNLCRCTGYKKIIEAIHEASRNLRVRHQKGGDVTAQVNPQQRGGDATE